MHQRGRRGHVAIRAVRTPLPRPAHGVSQRSAGVHRPHRAERPRHQQHRRVVPPSWLRPEFSRKGRCACCLSFLVTVTMMRLSLLTLTSHTANQTAPQPRAIQPERRHVRRDERRCALSHQEGGAGQTRRIRGMGIPR